MNRREALRAATARLAAAGCETARLDAQVLIADAIGITPVELITDRATPLSDAEAARVEAAVIRRAGREPVAYIVGRKGFRMIELEVDRRVLIPRPETEHVVEAALDLPAGARVVDVGTGSGAIALALKHERPDLAIVATDVSEDAVAVARANAERLGLEVELVATDLLSGVPGPVDAIVSNPPYVEDGAALAPEITRHEPAGALYAGADGLDVIGRLVPQAADAGAARLILEVGAGQAAAVGDLMRRAGFEDVVLHNDLAGIERVVDGRHRAL